MIPRPIYHVEIRSYFKRQKVYFICRLASTAPVTQDPCRLSLTSVMMRGGGNRAHVRGLGYLVDVYVRWLRARDPISQLLVSAAARGVSGGRAGRGGSGSGGRRARVNAVR